MSSDNDHTMNFNKTNDINIKKISLKKDEQLPINRGKVIISNNSKQADNVRKNYKSKLMLPFNHGKAVEDTESLSNDWQKLMMNTFEKFLLQLDELFMNLRAEEKFKCTEVSPDFSCYQDICEKLRLEVLIAIDKLGLVTSSRRPSNGQDMEFLNKMTSLKGQLSEIRWQYHNAIKNLK